MIWDACNGPQHIVPLKGLLYRMVESQEQKATRSMVDSLEEQALLEIMLDEAKPPYPLDSIETFDGLDYLLTTPFRYPPLDYGSRFGGTFEPSLFYGALSIEPVLAETAYYRFVYLHSMEIPPQTLCSTEHTLLSVRFKTNNGVRLHMTPFDTHREALTHKSDYTATQQLGAAMCDAGVDGFEYRSARDINQGICIGLFNPTPFVDRKVKEATEWFCEATIDMVAFKAKGEAQVYRFSIEQYLVDELFPVPA